MQIDPGQLHTAIRACRRCVEAGHLEDARPVFQGHGDEPVMLVGQAPGIVEVPAGIPFAGRSGRELARWMERAGVGDGSDGYRRFVYVTSVTKCFPGRARAGGDRRPSTPEILLCRPWLRSQLEMVQPRLLVLVGQLSASQFIPPAPLAELLGRPWLTHGLRAEATEAPRELTEEVAVKLLALGTRGLAITLPHPSGASRWLNAAANRDALDSALARLGRLVAAARGVED